jgi:hypothetical protein
MQPIFIEVLSLPPFGRHGFSSAALRAATASLILIFYLSHLRRPAGGERQILLESARGLRAPGPCAYFWPAPKVGKNALKPTV